MTQATPAPAPSGATNAVTTMQHVPLSQIFPSKTNPRKHFDSGFITELSGLIKKNGFFGAILIRPHPSKKDAFEIVAGEQRYRASKEAGLETIPADIRALSDIEALELQVIENLARRDLTPLEEADGYNQLLKANYTPQRIAERVGRTDQYVRDRCRLLKLVQGARELLEKGMIEVGHAILLARLDADDQIRAIRFPDEVFFADRSGLWQRQRDLLKSSADLAKEERWDDLEEQDDLSELKAVSVRELQAWISKHVRIKVDAPENAELFPEIHAAHEASTNAAEGEKPIKVIQITHERKIADDAKVKGARVYGPQSWQRADGRDGSKSCEHSLAGVIVVGDGYGEAFNVCIDKKRCKVHFAAEIHNREQLEKDLGKSGATGADRAELERKKKAEAEAARKATEKRYVRALPSIRAAFAERAKSAPVDFLKGRVLAGLGQGLSDRDFTAAAKELPPGNTLEGWVRTLALAAVIDSTDLNWQKGFDSYEQEQLRDDGKKWSVDVVKLVESANANEAASKEARAAKKKPAGKSTSTKVEKPPRTASAKKAKAKK